MFPLNVIAALGSVIADLVAGTDGASAVGYNAIDATGSLDPDLNAQGKTVVAVNTSGTANSWQISLEGVLPDDNSSWVRCTVNGTFADAFTGDQVLNRDQATGFVSAANSVWTFFNNLPDHRMVDGNSYTVTWE